MAKRTIKFWRGKSLVNESTENLTPVRAIRRKCLDCCGGYEREVRECELDDCPLWDYRLGKNPSRKKRPQIDSEP